MIEQLKNLSSDMKVQVLSYLIENFVKTLHNKKYTIPKLIREMNCTHNSLYKNPEMFRDNPFFSISGEPRNNDLKQYFIQLNLQNFLVKELVAMELFQKHGTVFSEQLAREVDVINKNHELFGKKIENNK